MIFKGKEQFYCFLSSCFWVLWTMSINTYVVSSAFTNRLPLEPNLADFKVLLLNNPISRDQARYVNKWYRSLVNGFRHKKTGKNRVQKFRWTLKQKEMERAFMPYLNLLYHGESPVYDKQRKGFVHYRGTTVSTAISRPRRDSLLITKFFKF